MATMENETAYSISLLELGLSTSVHVQEGFCLHWESSQPSRDITSEPLSLLSRGITHREKQNTRQRHCCPVSLVSKGQEKAGRLCHHSTLATEELSGPGSQQQC